MGAQRLFDLTQFHALTVQFDLMVDASRKLQPAIVSPAAQISRAIESPVRRLDESLRREFRVVQIAARQTRPADPNFAHHTRRQWIAVIATDGNACVGQGPSHRQWSIRVGVRRQLFAADEDGGLSGPIHVPEGEVIRVTSDVVMVWRLATAQQDAHSLERRLLTHAQIGGGVEGHGDAVRFVPLLHRPGIVAQSPRYRYKSHAMQKCPSQFPKGCVEARSRDQRKAILGCVAKRFATH